MSLFCRTAIEAALELHFSAVVGQLDGALVRRICGRNGGARPAGRRSEWQLVSRAPGVAAPSIGCELAGMPAPGEALGQAARFSLVILDGNRWLHLLLLPAERGQCETR